MTVELKPEQERMIRQQLASGLYKSVEDVLTTALSQLPHDQRFDRESRKAAVRRMREFGERHQLSLGEPVTRQFLHEEHRA